MYFWANKRENLKITKPPRFFFQLRNLKYSNIYYIFWRVMYAYSIIYVLFFQSWAVGTRQLFSFTTTTTRQRNIAQGPGTRKNRKIVRPPCLDGVATINIVKWQLHTTLWPDNMVTLSQQNCRVCFLKLYLYIFPIIWYSRS